MMEKGVCDEQPEVTIRGQRSHDMLRPIGLIDVSDHRLSHTCKPSLSREPSIYANADRFFFQIRHPRPIDLQAGRN